MVQSRIGSSQGTPISNGYRRTGKTSCDGPIAAYDSQYFEFYHFVSEKHFDSSLYTAQSHRAPQMRWGIMQLPPSCMHSNAPNAVNVSECLSDQSTLKIIKIFNQLELATLK